MADWRDRLLEGIALTAPDGQQFVAGWKGDERSVEKRLGIFNYPEIPGSAVQDMDVSAIRYPLTIYFEGPNHDLESAAFFEACRLRGPWTVNHPVLGALILQLVEASEKIQPVESGNLTVIATEWIEPFYEELVRKSVVQLGAAIRDKAAVVNDQSAESFSKGIKFSRPASLSGFIDNIASVTVKVGSLLNPLTQTVGEINAAMISVQRGITGTLNAAVLSVVGLASQLQTLVQLPASVQEDLSVRLDYYTDLINEVISYPPPEEANDHHTVQIITTSALVAMSTAVVDGELTTREEALAAIDRLRANLDTVLSALDSGQSDTGSSSIDEQFFTMTDSYNDIVQMVTLTTELLLRRSFDLAVAKRIILKKDRAPVEIAITEQVDLDLFISTNGLKDRDILLLPAGREVVVYL